MEKCWNCKKEIPEGAFDFMPKLQGNCCSADCYKDYRDILIKHSRGIGQQRIVCAANKHKAGHILCGKLLLNEDFIQGFIDNKGNFLDRKEAYKVAMAAGQIIECMEISAQNRNDPQLQQQQEGGNLKIWHCGVNQDEDLILQEASYIEDGFYIREMLCGGFEIMLIPQYGGEPSSEGTFTTLKETFIVLDKMKQEYT